MSVKFGTCSWNYDSWVGLIYDRRLGRAADYLSEYAKIYSTVEIDSWFYRIPVTIEAQEYKNQVPPHFTFTCKAPQELTLTHYRHQSGGINPNFLSIDLFSQFIDAIHPILPQTEAIMLQFEYLNRQKMPSFNDFLAALERFFTDIPKEFSLAVEIRNKNYLNTAYFKLLQKFGISPVLVEKQFMPPVSDIARRYGKLFNDKVVIRLLGGDRKDIEDITGKKWNRIVREQNNLQQIARMLENLQEMKKDIIVNVNNHYEGSAPLSIKRLEKFLLIND